MKKIFFTLVIINLSFLSIAQNKIALIAGMQSCNITEKNNLPVWSDNGSVPDWNAVRKDYLPRIGFHAGIMAQLSFSETSKFYFEPGVVFNNKGRKFTFSKDTLAVKKRIGLPDTLIWTRYNFTQKQYFSYIDMPLNLVYKISIGKKGKFRIGGGPALSFFFNGFDKQKHELLQIGTRNEDNLDLPVGEGKGQYLTMYFAINASAGIEFKNIFFTVDYNRGINSFYKSKFYEGSFYPQNIGVTIGIFLKK